jgi:hypothetical protein
MLSLCPTPGQNIPYSFVENSFDAALAVPRIKPHPSSDFTEFS